jgi:hypothetical protein
MVKTDKTDKITAVSYIMPLRVKNLLVVTCCLVSVPLYVYIQKLDIDWVGVIEEGSVVSKS